MPLDATAVSVAVVDARLRGFARVAVRVRSSIRSSGYCSSANAVSGPAPTLYFASTDLGTEERYTRRFRHGLHFEYGWGAAPYGNVLAVGAVTFVSYTSDGVWMTWSPRKICFRPKAARS